MKTKLDVRQGSKYLIKINIAIFIYMRSSYVAYISAFFLKIQKYMKWGSGRIFLEHLGILRHYCLASVGRDSKMAVACFEKDVYR